MEVRKLIFLISLLFYISGYSQTLTGVVLDAKTSKPIESASIYFDNTTIGTTTNLSGEFTINYSNAIKSSLIVSFLGYKTEIIDNYRKSNTIIVKLNPAVNVLNEVFITNDDGLTREQKLKIFKRQFLGFSRFSNSCKISNKEDIILRYFSEEKKLVASSLKPIQIFNKGLQYSLTFDIQNFEIKFSNVDLENEKFIVNYVAYFGRTFFKNFEKINVKKAKRNREKVYQGSALKFMRSLYSDRLEEDGFDIYFKREKVDPKKYFTIKTIEDSSERRISLKKPITVLYRNKNRTDIEFLSDSISVDQYGNYHKITDVIFSGFIGNQRVGDLLPFDYGLEMKSKKAEN